MGLLHKVRILLGALVHKPFMPQTEKVELDKGRESPRTEAKDKDRPALEVREAEVQDGERVADLIAQRRRDEAGSS